MLKKLLLGFALVGSASLAFHAFGLTHVLPWFIKYSDVIPFAKRAIGPGWIYIDKTIEYPVFIGVFISIVGKLAPTVVKYYFLNSSLLIIVGLVTTYFLYQLVDEKNRKNLWTYWVLAPSIFFFLVYNWDIWAVCFSVIAFYLIKKQHDVWASVFLALGFLSKVYPALFLLPLLIRQKTWKSRILSVLSFAAVSVAANLFFALKNFKAWFFFFHFSSVRAADYGSLWKLIVPLFPPWLYDVQTLNFVSLLLFAIVYLYLMWRYRHASLILVCFWSTLLFLLLNKVFSPQYTLWLLPFFVLLNWQNKKIFYGLEIANLIYLFSVLSYVFEPHSSLGHVTEINFTIVRLVLIVCILAISTRQHELDEAHA